MKALNPNLQQKPGRRERGEDETPYLPTDLYAEILSWLPSDFLLTLKLVCKEWNLLISSSEFIEKHLERSKALCSNPRILVPFPHDTLIFKYYRSGIHCNKVPLGCYYVSLIGSCDGLVLYYDRCLTKEIGVFNPTTGKHEEVCEPSQSFRDDINGHDLICTWFGRHPSTGVYVLVLANSSKLGQTKHMIMFKVYSLSRNLTLLSSTELEVDRNYTRRHHFGAVHVGTLLHGRLHCYAFARVGPIRYDILAYDFHTNGIERLQPPPLDLCRELGAVAGCLCAISASEVWMMEEYGDKESWRKYADIKGRSVCCSMRTAVHDCANVGIILNSRNLSKLPKKGSGVVEYVICSGMGHSMACLDSLVSPAVVLKETTRELVEFDVWIYGGTEYI